MERKNRAAKALRAIAPASLALTLALVALPGPLVGQPVPASPVSPARAPGEIVEAAPAEDWRPIPASDLLVMTLAPAANGTVRRIVIQLIPAPFPQAHARNARMLAAARWWDGLAIVRVQDNYVVQWGDPDGEGPTPKPLPPGLEPTGADDYAADIAAFFADAPVTRVNDLSELVPAIERFTSAVDASVEAIMPELGGAYAPIEGFRDGWPYASDGERVWPVHCYGMVGVGRNYPPDAGTGAELYTVIGQAPRHLDRNIALIGRVIDGIEHLSSLPRGTGPLGFYENPAERVHIASIAPADSLPTAERPRFEWLDTDSPSFARYADARANRRDSFFIAPAGGADLCNIPVPIRKVTQ